MKKQLHQSSSYATNTVRRTKESWSARNLLLAFFMSALPLVVINAQCINTSSFGSATVGTSDLTPVSITTCNYASEYAAITVTGAGNYEFSSSVTTDYITITDASNTVISHGAQPHTASIASSGTYRMHITLDDSCNTASICRATTVAYSPCLSSTAFGTSTIGATNSTPVTFTTCIYAGEYRTLNVTDAGPYQFASSVSTDFMTFTDANDSVIATGPGPLTVNVATSGTYRVHVLADATCGTQSSCRSLTGVALVPLCGTYTIDPGQAASTTNFQSFSAFATQINALGVSCAVTVNVAPGAYTDQFTLDGIGGLSMTNTLTINGGDAATTSLSHDGSTSNATVLLDGVDYVTIKNMTIASTKSAADAWGIFLTNRADFVTIDSCTINMEPSTGNDIAGIVASDNLAGSFYGGDNAHDLTISNCSINEGYYGYRHEGGDIGSDADTNITVTNNVFHNNYGYGTYLDDIYGATFTGNTVSGAGASFKDGMYNSDVNDFNYEANTVWAPDYALVFFDGNFDGTQPTGRSKIVNNMLYSSEDEALYLDDFEKADVYHNSCKTDGTSTSANGCYVNDLDDVSFKNNIFYSNAGDAFYSVDAATSLPMVSIDYNVYYTVSGDIGRIGSSGTYATLAAWQTADATRNVSSVEGDPVFVSATDLHCLGSTANDVGDNTVGITVDIDGDTRPASGSTIVDIGADEFTALSADLALIDGMFVRGNCYSSNDSVKFYVQNVIGGTVNFATNPLTLNWSVMGPANSNGTVTVNTGTLAAGDTLMVEDDGVNMPIYGSYTLMASIDSNASNQSPLNDNLSPVSTAVPALLSANPNSIVVTSTMDTVVLEASSPFFPNPFITEICHFRGSSTGAPTGGWPTYLSSDDYIEITGPPGMDLAGYVLETWSTSSLTYSHTFPANTLLSSSGTAIIGVGSSPGTSSPTDFYYVAQGGSYSSSTAAGRIIKNPGGTILDAVGYSGSTSTAYEFPAAAGVSSSDWSNSLLGGSGSAGIRLEGSDVNSGANWILSATNSQDPNTVNSMVTVPAPPPVAGFSWNYNGSIIDTNLSTEVGPFTMNGTYKYVAAYNSASCGMVYDTATVIVAIPCLYNAPWSESFESSAWTIPTSSCNYSDGIDTCWARIPNGYSPMSWVMRTGSTCSSNTGPSGASDSSNYVYLETSSGGSDAELWTPTIDVSTVTNPELRFDYHMYGATIGTLYTEITTDGGSTWTSLDSISGAQQSASSDPWLERIVDISGYTGQVRIRFRGSYGGSFTGDMAIDNVRIDARPPSCPVTDVPSVMGQTSCGPTPVTFTATGNTNPNQGYFWMNTDSAIVGLGDMFTTPSLTATTDYYVGIGALNDAVAKQHVGPLPSIATAGFGNFTNGQWFTAQDFFYLDSITVRSNGALAFQVRISEPGAAGAGAELLLSDTITVSGAGDHQVEVGIPVAPGNYFININFIAGAGTGQLFRATSGAVYPYSISGLVSIDSVNFPGARYYYTYDWVVSEVCTSTLATATATLGTLPSTAFPYSVDFNTGLPCNWSTDNSGAEWMNVSDLSGNSLDSTNFMLIDDDAVGSGVTTQSSLITPSFDTQGYDTLFMSFDHYFRALGASRGYVEVWDGATWVAIDSFSANTGAWFAPVTQSYDITMYQNTNLQVRFRYDDGGAFAWYWAVDNFAMDGTPLPCTNVVVDILTDTWGSETTWSIVDTATGTSYASGGPYPNALIANYVDTICLPEGIWYEFRLNDSFGDGLFDGTNTGTYSVDILCPWGNNNVISGSGAFPYGGPGGTAASWDSTVFEVTCLVTCPDPDSLMAMADCDEATLSWVSDSSAVSSTIQWGPAGFTPGTGTIITNATSPYNLTGLALGTSYDFWVLDSCVSGTVSNYSGPYTFTTDTLPVVSASHVVTGVTTVASVDFTATGTGTSYAWDFGDGNSGTGANTTHDYTANGTYTVVVTATNDCGSSTDTIQVVIQGIGLDEYGFGDIGLYPNPNDGYFTVTGLTEFGNDATIEVVTLTGTVVYNEKIVANGSESFIIDMRGYAPGVYYVRVSSEKGVGSKPFVIRD